MSHTNSLWRNACVVVPMYNESSVIAEVVSEVLGHFDRVVCVDDGSTDDSAALARAAGATVVQHPINLGQGAALETGIRFALRDPVVSHVVTFDADGQHSVTDAEAMVRRAVEDDVQVVLGSRFLGSSEQVPLARRLLLRGATWFSRATTGLVLSDAHNGLRVLRRDAAQQLSLKLHGMSHASEILGKIAAEKWSYVEHPVTITYTDYSRAKGQRAYNAFNIAFDVAVSRVRHAA
ncbi:MAG: glycosyltransferase family 2 protein [Nocardioides sp.]|uniref:glycosyltransferase family 2 protein n=1 Tax=Nocardioides sp. TaxID=35761 RepID=UPI000C8E3485|nr:glycosyltransferase family 2 protein [Nocardioides sp.]MAS56091.1 glycosyl transferase [Pimelobacter sp.]MDE0775064.1 glycosyltransferase family 2 protein [Nocardioides sp.]